MTDQSPPPPTTSSAPPPAPATGPDAPVPGDLPPRPHPRRRQWLALAGSVAFFVLAAAFLVAVLVSEDGPSEYRVVVPAGTGTRLDAGEQVVLVDSDLRLSVNDTFVVENRDDRTHEVGPFTVRPGETLRHTFTTPGRYEGACTIHPSGSVVITVT
jgi:plastocyanin